MPILFIKDHSFNLAVSVIALNRNIFTVDKKAINLLLTQ